MARRSKHNLSHYRLSTANMGQLIPVGLTEVLPGDTIQHQTGALIRLSPMAAPVMHPVTIRVHHFFVPHRLSWGDRCGKAFEEFITGGPDGDDASVIPTVETTGTPKDLLDYYGVPPVSGINVSALPIRGFNLIYNEFYRDADLAAEREEDDLTVPLVAWEKDYFTAARPWPQKGPEITLPLTGAAPVVPSGNIEWDVGGNKYAQALGDPGQQNWLSVPASEAAGHASYSAGLEADLAQASAASVNDVRRAFALQRFAEARSRYGSRYTEYLRYMAGVEPPDSRLQRPEFLAGGKQRVAVSEVLQTSNEPGGQQDRFGVGDLYGHGVAAMRASTYRKHFVEHGYVHTLLSVRPRAIYSNGIHRTWLRKDREDFYQRELEFIGQQEVKNNEVYADADQGDETFAYNDRYREYRENPSCVSGEFRDTLNYWHLAREFESLPTLNQSFTDCSPSKRIFNEQTADSLWIQVQHRMVARRIVAKSAYGKII